MLKYALLCVPVPLKANFIYSFDSEEHRVCPGIRVTVPFGKGNRKTHGFVIDVLDTIPKKDFSEKKNFTIKKIIRVIDKIPVFSEQTYKLALWMEDFYFSSRGIILDAIIPGGKKDISTAFFDELSLSETDSFILSDEQDKAVRTVFESDKKFFYLYGITGSGKTEVFLRCAEEIIKKKGQVIYLVPEITLTHQLAKQVAKRFENNVAILHSALTDSQRISQWRKIKAGEVGLVIGARSAVFAPCSNLKMIIIDEEHDNSYKSSNNPRYHARQIAQHRIEEVNGKLLMGSATPSLEAWYMMKNSSKLVRLNLTERVGGGKMPSIELVDMNKVNSILSPKLLDKMSKVLSSGKQVILFLNRRGFSYYFHCTNCGYELKCPNCDIAMTLHKRSNELVCHYCGYKQRPVRVCPSCGSLDVLYSGFGTEQIEEQVKKIFPEYCCARLDTDIVSSDRKIISKTLDSFKREEIKILVGTQMVAKGLNFPNVSLVGIVLADGGLLLPDFRAEERTFDLLVQVSGRSGRADNNGEVIIQTRMINNTCVNFAKEMKTEQFLDRELRVRKETGFPPFSRLVNIVCRSKNRDSAFSSADAIASLLRKQNNGFEVFGAQECIIEKLRNNWRFQVLIRSKNVSEMFKALKNTLNKIKIPNSVIMEVDVDPLEIV